jgi:hypothetical protein
MRCGSSAGRAAARRGVAGGRLLRCPGSRRIRSMTLQSATCEPSGQLFTVYGEELTQSLSSFPSPGSVSSGCATETTRPKKSLTFSAPSGERSSLICWSAIVKPGSGQPRQTDVPGRPLEEGEALRVDAHHLSGLPAVRCDAGQAPVAVIQAVGVPKALRAASVSVSATLAAPARSAGRRGIRLPR